MRRQLLFLIFIFSCLLSISNYIGEEFNLYKSTIWYDAMCHTIGGIVVAGVFLYFTSHKEHPKKILVFLFVLLVGVLWEFYELYTGFMHISDSGYYLDTVGDLCFDLIGANIMIWLNRKICYAE